MAGLGWQELVILLVLFGYGGIGVWIYKDAQRRGMSGIAWLALWLFFHVFALVVYLFVRPRTIVQPSRQSALPGPPHSARAEDV